MSKPVTELAAEWRDKNPPGVVSDVDAIAAAYYADALEASLREHPVVLRDDLIERRQLSGVTFETCRIRLCFYEKGHPDPGRGGDLPHADWCPAAVTAAEEAAP